MSDADIHASSNAGRPDPRLAREARDWVVRLASGEVAADDLQQFHSWKAKSGAHASAFEQERRFWQQLGGLAAPAPVVDLAQKRAGLRIGRRGLIAGGLAAAAGAWMFDLPGQLQDWTSDLHTGFGEMAAMTLPDGSVATLNTDSAIQLNFREGRREVALLRGEAEFLVPEDNGPHLRVTALDGYTEARGSLFSVGIEAGRARVTVAEGQARISTANGAGIELGPSEQAIYEAGRSIAALGPVARDVAFAWREGRIIFEGKRFDDALAELARYVPEKVMTGRGVNLSMPVSAIFSTTAAHEAITALALTQGLSVRRVPQVVILVS